MNTEAEIPKAVPPPSPPSRAEIAMLMAIYACQGNQNMLDELADRRYDNYWREAGIWQILENESIGPISAMEHLSRKFEESSMLGAAATNHNAIRLLWNSPPCPRPKYILAALNGMLEAAGHKEVVVPANRAGQPPGSS